MIELEIQALSATREHLLVDLGRVILAHGFTLQQQRLMLDANGVLVTLVVRGSKSGRRPFEAALEAHERIISFQISAFSKDRRQPHFAASRAPSGYVAPPAPASDAAESDTVVESDHHPISNLIAAPPQTSVPAPLPTGEPVALNYIEFIQPNPPPLPEQKPAQAAEPYVDIQPLDADEAAVGKALQTLARDYPRILPQVQQLALSVAEGARDSSLALAGRQTGAWVSARQPGGRGLLALPVAIEQVAVPALGEVVDVVRSGNQLQIRHSPLCPDGGPSGCKFFSGFVEEVLRPVAAANALSVFEVCCRSFGAEVCVLAISD